MESRKLFLNYDLILNNKNLFNIEPKFNSLILILTTELFEGRLAHCLIRCSYSLESFVTIGSLVYDVNGKCIGFIYSYNDVYNIKVYVVKRYFIKCKGSLLFILCPENKYLH